MGRMGPSFTGTSEYTVHNLISSLYAGMKCSETGTINILEKFTLISSIAVFKLVTAC